MNFRPWLVSFLSLVVITVSQSAAAECGCGERNQGVSSFPASGGPGPTQIESRPPFEPPPGDFLLSVEARRKLLEEALWAGAKIEVVLEVPGRSEYNGVSPDYDTAYVLAMDHCLRYNNFNWPLCGKAATEIVRDERTSETLILTEKGYREDLATLENRKEDDYWKHLDRLLARLLESSSPPQLVRPVGQDPVSQIGDRF